MKSNGNGLQQSISGGNEKEKMDRKSISEVEATELNRWEAKQRDK